MVSVRGGAAALSARSAKPRERIFPCRRVELTLTSRQHFRHLSTWLRHRPRNRCLVSAQHILIAGCSTHRLREGVQKGGGRGDGAGAGTVGAAGGIGRGVSRRGGGDRAGVNRPDGLWLATV